MTPAERSASARYAARLSHLRHPGRERTAAARAGLYKRFEDAVDADGRLSEQERQRRADQLRGAWFAHLSFTRLRGRKPGTLNDFLDKYGPDTR